MLLSDFDYELPEELIAQQPLEQRDASRMLILDRATQTHEDSKFELLPEYVRAGDVVIGPATYEAVKDKYDVAQLGLFALKGLSTNVPLYKILGPRA